ncbi:MAG: DUF5684 domain-containing protein [Anaerolineae bacterium]|nr:DUF5684 domain-containing protein [Anaerolineae bacterium]MDW8100362.1 DUF5684 domain-containing protein [Anaerolineae bacterium]
MLTSIAPISAIFQQGGEGELSIGLLVLILALTIVFIAGIWKTFQKAGQPGWGALIPIYNAYLMLKIAGRPGWWLILLLIPAVNIIILLLVCLDIAAAFGKSAVFGVIMLFLLSGLGFLILGFGSAKYIGPTATRSAGA